jgi:imidazolonepropionase-like amidohydrolase
LTIRPAARVLLKMKTASLRRPMPVADTRGSHDVHQNDATIMTLGTPPALAAAAFMAAVALASPAQAPRPVHPRPVLITGGTLFDGTGAAAYHNDAILIVNARIKAIGPQAVRRPPKEARRIDATGKWIIPGLIDGHVHFFQTGGLDARPDVVANPKGERYRDVVAAIRRSPEAYLRAYICSGITSVVDPGGPMWEFDLRDSREDDPLSPRIAFSGPLLATYDPPALELEDDDPIWLMKDEAGIGAMVDRLSARNPAMIKIWFVHRPGEDLQAQAALVTTAIRAIHAAKLRAAVHATTLETARVAVDAGADILVHSVGDRDLDDAFVRQVVDRNIIYVPTLVVGKSYREVSMRQVVFEPFERECAPPGTIESFDVLPALPESILPRRSLPPDPLPVQQRNLKRLAEAGAAIAAGTDAGNTRTLHGPSLHRELALMVDAGLTPAAVLLSATREGARLMGRERDVGQIAPGMLGDLVVLDADPLADIHNTRRIAMVVRGGAVYQR